MGYGLAALTKPLFPLANGVGLIVTARFVDRVGKGIRGAPRDALVADITPESMRGAAYGIRQSMDTIGAFAGPLVAMGLMMITHDNFRLVFWVAVLPAAVLCGVHRLRRSRARNPCPSQSSTIPAAPAVRCAAWV